MAYIGTNPRSAPAVYGGADWSTLPGLLAQLGQPYPQSNPVHQQLGQVQANCRETSWILTPRLAPNGTRDGA